MEETAFKEFIKGKNVLFHYTKLSTAIEHIIPSLTLKLRTLDEMSDPNESIKTVMYIDEYDEDRIISKDKGLINYVLGCRIASFCSNDIPKIILKKGKSEYSKHNVLGYKKSRMWCQYGDRHKGVCLVFDKEKLKKKFEDAGGFLEEITYTEDLGIPKLQAALCQESAYSDYLKINKNSLFMTKYLDYRDEYEVRGLVFDTSIQYIDIKDCVKGIILGYNVSKVYHPLIKKIAEESKIGWSKLSWDYGFPRLYDSYLL